MTSYKVWWDHTAYWAYNILNSKSGLPCLHTNWLGSFSRDSKSHAMLENILGLFWCLYKYFAKMFYPGTRKIEKWMCTAKFECVHVTHWAWNDHAYQSVNCAYMRSTQPGLHRWDALPLWDQQGLLSFQGFMLRGGARGQYLGHHRFCLMSSRLVDRWILYLRCWFSVTQTLTWIYVYTCRSVTYISWSSDFALYLEDYLLDKCHNWDIGSMWCKDLPH